MSVRLKNQDYTKNFGAHDPYHPLDSSDNVGRDRKDRKDVIV